MITKKKKYTLYYVMALACGLVASFFIYSCSADGYYSVFITIEQPKLIRNIRV